MTKKKSCKILICWYGAKQKIPILIHMEHSLPTGHLKNKRPHPFFPDAAWIFIVNRYILSALSGRLIATDDYKQLFPKGSKILTWIQEISVGDESSETHP